MRRMFKALAEWVSIERDPKQPIEWPNYQGIPEPVRRITVRVGGWQWVF